MAWVSSVPPTPWTFAFVSRSAETVATPGTFATAGPTAAGIGEKPSSWSTAMLPASVRSMRLSIDARRPLANTVTNTTSASPIISAAEVTAVRPGWRVEFSRASRPTSLVDRSIGAATIRAAGPTKRGEVARRGAEEARGDQRDAEDQDDRAAGGAEQLRRGVAALREEAGDDES